VAEITIQLKKVKKLAVQVLFHKSLLPPAFCLPALVSSLFNPFQISWSIAIKQHLGVTDW
jgi:hypothetical protein